MYKCVYKIVNKCLQFLKIPTCKKTAFVVNLRMTEQQALQEIRDIKDRIEYLQKRLDKIEKKNHKKVQNE